jgi:hypothetical protein
MPNVQKPNSNRSLIVALTVLVLVVTSILVLKFTPLKLDTRAYPQVYTMAPEISMTTCFDVPKGMLFLEHIQ